MWGLTKPNKGVNKTAGVSSLTAGEEREVRAGRTEREEDTTANACGEDQACEEPPRLGGPIGRWTTNSVRASSGDAAFRGTAVGWRGVGEVAAAERRGQEEVRRDEVRKSPPLIHPCGSKRDRRERHRMTE